MTQHWADYLDAIAVGNKVVAGKFGKAAAYFPERKRMMQAWANCLDALTVGTVVGNFGKAA